MSIELRLFLLFLHGFAAWFLTAVLVGTFMDAS